MPTAVLRRVAAAGLTALLATSAIATTALADALPADADLLTPGNQSVRDFGKVAPGAIISADLGFTLTCRNGSHVDAGQVVSLTWTGGTIPADGDATATGASLGPVVPPWPADGDLDCGAAKPLAASQPSHVTLTAPTVPGFHTYTLVFAPSLSPEGNADDSALPSLVFVDYRLEVVSNTPPVVTVPADLTREAIELGGAHVRFDAAATDAEDDPDPAATCSPASGSFFPVGSTTVTCTVEDSGGLTDEASFTVTVVDTTAPTLSGVPTALRLATADPSGSTLTFDPPTATDVVDPAPAVACDPTPGARIPVGTTLVTCTATDRSGNEAAASFPVTVEHVAAKWSEPIGPSRELAAKAGRSVPVKVEVVRGGSVARTGSVALVVAPCGGGANELVQALTWSGDRWSAKLDTAGLGGGCHRATLVVDGVGVDSFVLRLSTDTQPAKR